MNTNKNLPTESQSREQDRAKKNRGDRRKPVIIVSVIAIILVGIFFIILFFFHSNLRSGTKYHGGTILPITELWVGYSGIRLP